MLKIKLTRVGKKHTPLFRIVVAPDRSKNNGEMVDYLGSYDPLLKSFKVDKEKVLSWMKKGAKPTDTVKLLLIKQNILPKEKNLKKYKVTPGKKKQARAEAKSKATQSVPDNGKEKVEKAKKPEKEAPKKEEKIEQEASE
jgi:small subunit ribosomal protein S16